MSTISLFSQDFKIRRTKSKRTQALFTVGYPVHYILDTLTVNHKNNTIVSRRMSTMVLNHELTNYLNMNKKFSSQIPISI